MSQEIHIPKGCPLDRLLRLLAGEWTSHILIVLSNNGPTRHGELKRLVDGISAKVLTDRLRLLAAEGLVDRAAEATIPPKVTYTLTERGHRLDNALRELEKVAREW